MYYKSHLLEMLSVFQKFTYLMYLYILGNFNVMCPILLPDSVASSKNTRFFNYCSF